MSAKSRNYLASWSFRSIRVQLIGLFPVPLWARFERKTSALVGLVSVACEMRAGPKDRQTT